MDQVKNIPLTGDERAKRCRDKKKATNSTFQDEENKRIEALRKEKVNRMGVLEKKQYKARVAERVRRRKRKKTDALKVKGKFLSDNLSVDHQNMHFR